MSARVFALIVALAALLVAPAARSAPPKDAPSKDAPSKDAPSKDAPSKDAPSKEACATAFEETQISRADARLIEARRQALVCAAAGCPAWLRAPCLEWLDEIEAAIPSVVVAVVDDRGQDRPADVSIDGRVVPEAAAGQPVALDPGSHRLEATIDGRKVVVEVVLRAGEQLRRVTLRAADGGSAAGPRRATPEPSAASRAGLTTAGWIALSIGGAGLITGAVGGGLALAAKGELDDVCPTKTTCPPARQGDIDAMMTLSHVSTAGFAVGAVGVTVGVILLAIRGDDDEPGAATSPRGFDARSLRFVF